MILLLHGAAGGWDELLIAAVAFGVLWFAVKLAGRKPAQDDDEDVVTDAQTVAKTNGQDTDPAQTKATRLS
jgi:hypothetical protein